MLNSDLPIKNSSEDLLNRTSFAESLAKVLIEHDAPEGFAIGLYGKWGSGKTSVINMVLEKVNEYSAAGQKPVVLRFNPWLCSDPKQLISQFFKQLSTAINDGIPDLEKVCKALYNYAEVFEMAKIIPVAGNVLSVAGKILGRKAKDYLDAQNNELQKIKNRIIEALSEQKIKIIITIDDIDRLSNEEIVSVFQLVKSLADFPHAIYLLAFDREVVIEALKDIQKGNGEEYLEKVIQVPFELPAPNIDRIHRLFLSKMSTNIGDIDEERWDTDYWNELFQYGLKDYLQSIRDVMRYINTFSLKYNLLKDETNVIDLIGLTCIQVFEPNAYSMLQNYKKELCGSLDFLGSDGEEKIKKAYDQITHGIINDRMDSAINILVRLFPKLNIPFHTSHVWGTPIHRNHPESLHSRSICNPHCFDRYFALSLEDEDIPSQTIEYLLFNATEAEFSDELLKINASKRTTRLLEHFYAEIKAISDKGAYQERAKLVLKVLTSHWHLLEDSEDDLLFSSWFYHHLLTCTNALLEVLSTLERLDVMRSIFADTNVPLSTTICQLREFEKWHNRFTDKKSAEKDALLTLEEVLELESVFVHRTSKKIKSKEILDEKDFLRIIWLFERIDEDKASELTGNMVSSDFDLARLVSACVSHGKAASKYVYKTWTVHKDAIQKYIDITVAYERIKIFVFTSEFDDLPQVKKENIAAFLVEMEMKDDAQRFNDHIVISQIERKLEELEELNIMHLAEQSRESL